MTVAGVIVRGLAILAIAAMVALSPAAVGGASAEGTTAVWSRNLDAYPLSLRSGIFILTALPGGGVLVRSGAGVAALDPVTGKTLWFLAGVLDASLDGTSVLVRRRDVVFAVRARDAAVVWKRPCVNARYVVGVGSRALTACGDTSTVLDGSNGALRGRRPIVLTMSAGDIRGARSLNGRFAMIANSFDGAWGGMEYAIVDAATGTYEWSQTDFAILDVSPDSILIAPYPGMLPWAPTGTVVRRRLVDGAVLGRRVYQLPMGSDPDERGVVTVSPSAVYVSTQSAGLFRFATGTSSADEVAAHAEVEAVLGNAVFYAIKGAQFGVADLYVERPREHDFSNRSIGRYSGLIAAGGDDQNAGSFGEHVAIRTGDVVVASRTGSVDVLDESGTRILEVQNTCLANQRHVLKTGNRLYVLCDPISSKGRVVVSAYALR